MAEGLANWIATAMSHLKEWASIGGLALCCVLISVLAFWCICRMQHHHRMAQALLIKPLQLWRCDNLLKCGLAC